jgi:LAO/AO transport system kinase
VQVMKAGLLEIADVFVVNKADREGATRMRTELEMMLHLKVSEDGVDWQVPVLMTQASKNVGTEEVLAACRQHGAHLHERPGGKRLSDRARQEVLDICEEELMRRLRSHEDTKPLSDALDAVTAGDKDPYRAAIDILDSPEDLARLIAQKP